MTYKNIGKPFALYLAGLAGLSLLGIIMFMWGAVRGNGFSDWYLLWNLLLAWIPLILAYWLVAILRIKLWSSWTALGISLAWLLFLPNSFYMVSDYIHLSDMVRSDVLFDSLVFTVFVLEGLILGYTSLYLVQAEFRKRIGEMRSQLLSGVFVLLCSFAIYLGRELRWNSWDVLVNPAGILFDISERIIDPLAHPQTFSVTAMFFVFLIGLYWTLQVIVKAIGAYARAQRSW